MPATTFIDPSALAFSPPSPTPSSSYTHDDDHDDEAGPSRKRPRTSSSADSAPEGKELSVSEQRKEARAHRNRIAAQNSRDRRKAQFSYLERRVAELEEENRRLRAGIQVVSPPTVVPTSIPAPVQTHVFASQLALSNVLEDRLRAEREQERERENEELKERIKTLERGWDAVVKALATQGLPTGLSASAAPATPTTPSSTTPTTTAVNQLTPAPIPTTKPTFTAFPSPAPSHSSLEFELSTPTSVPSTLFAPSAPTVITPIIANNVTGRTSTSTQSDSTRHLARVATTGGTFIGSLGVPAAGGLKPSVKVSVSGNNGNNNSVPVPTGTATQGDEPSDKAMEDLFREILASPRAQHVVAVQRETAPVISTVAVTLVGREAEKAGEGEEKSGERCTSAEDTINTTTTVANNQKSEATTPNNNNENATTTDNNNNNTEDTANATAIAEWASEIEMQRILDDMVMMNGASSMGLDINNIDNISAMNNIDNLSNIDNLGLGMSLDTLSMDMDIGVDMGLGMDMGFGMGMDMGFGMDVQGQWA